MKIKISLLAILLATPVCLHAAEKADTSQQDPFDLSKNEKSIGELGVPTLSRVQVLEDKASELYKAQDWKAAAKANAEFAKAANWLSNIITAGLKPYYGASYDDRKRYKGNLSELGKFEKLANEFKTKRNRAIVLQAECSMKMGDREKGFALLLNALGHIDIDDTEYWNKARGMLYDLVEVK